MTDRPTAFKDLPREYFPFKVEFFLVETGKLVHVIEVEDAGAFEVPPLSTIHGGPIMVRTTYANGEVIEHRP